MKAALDAIQAKASATETVMPGSRRISRRATR